MKAFTERHLKGLWERQLPLREPLLAAQGEGFQVLHRGRPNGAGGPDYLDAVLRLEDGNLLRGDVEIHRRGQDWWHHGHQHDARYLGVILHGVGEPSEHRLKLANGRVPLTLNLPTLPQVVGGAKQGHVELCFGVWEPSADHPGLQMLDELGDQRFRNKARSLAAALWQVDRDQVLYEGLMMGLGYNRNQVPFRQLAQRLPLAALERYTNSWGLDGPETVLEALFLGSAGLLWPPAVVETGASRQTERWAWWCASGHQPLVEPALWRFDGVRPGNLPTQRLMAAARLVARWGTVGWVDRAWQRLLEGSIDGAPSRFIADLRGPGRTLGWGTAAILVVNVILPLLYADAERQKRPDLQSWPHGAYQRCPNLPTNAVTRFMEARLCGRAGQRLARTARQHQGLIHLYRAFCVQGCGEECPFAVGPEGRTHGVLAKPR